MKHQFLALLLILVMVTFPSKANANSNSTSFKMSVVLPAIVGVNVDEHGNHLASLNGEFKKAQNELITEEVRNNKTILVKTIVID